MLDFQLSTIIFTIINLLVLFLFFKKFLFGRVNAVLEQRAALIQKEMDSAKEQNRQAGELKAEYEEKLSAACQEASRLVADAQAKAQRAYDTQLSNAQADIRRLRSQAQEQMELERNAMLQKTRGEVASLALLAAAKVAEKSMDTSDDRALVESFLSEVEEKV